MPRSTQLDPSVGPDGHGEKLIRLDQPVEASAPEAQHARARAVGAVAWIPARRQHGATQRNLDLGALRRQQLLAHTGRRT